jgi:hypothetical protein
MSEIKENSNNIEDLTDPEDIVLAKIYKQVQSSIEGSDSAQNIDSILNLIDTDEQI